MLQRERSSARKTAQARYFQIIIAEKLPDSPKPSQHKKKEDDSHLEVILFFVCPIRNVFVSLSRNGQVDFT